MKKENKKRRKNLLINDLIKYLKLYLTASFSAVSDTQDSLSESLSDISYKKRKYALKDSYRFLRNCTK